MNVDQMSAGQATDLAGLLDLIENLRSGWREHAACKNPDVKRRWFAPEVGGVPIEARMICAGCPVVADCARFGADQADPTVAIGTVWAGEYPNQLAEWRDAGAPEWVDLMSGKTRTTRGMKRNRDRAAA